MTRCLVLTAGALLLAAAAHAGLAVVGEGATARFDPAGWPAEMQAKYPLMQAKCSNATCHTMERTVVAVTTGTAPMSNTPFDRQAAKAYGIKMMRKPDSGVNKEEAKTIVELLYFLIDEAKK